MMKITEFPHCISYYIIVSIVERLLIIVCAYWFLHHTVAYVEKIEFVDVIIIENIHRIKLNIFKANIKSFKAINLCGEFFFIFIKCMV